MDLDALALARDVARRGSFAAVAKDRDIDPSSVSRAVAALEARLGLRLFQRTTRRLSLTEAGAVYLSRIEPILDELDRAGADAAAIAGGPTGTLRMTASVTFGEMRIVPLLPEFRARYPDVALECRFTDRNVDLVAERVDLAVRLAPAISGDVVATRLIPTRYRVVASPDYLTASGPLRAPGDLADRSCLLLPIPDYRTRWRFRGTDGAISEVAITGAVTIEPALSLRQAALAGLGPALLADWLVGADIAAGRLVDVFPDHDVAATRFDTAAWLVYPSRAFLPAKVRVMIDFLKAHITAGTG